MTLPVTLLEQVDGSQRGCMAAVVDRNCLTSERSGSDRIPLMQIGSDKEDGRACFTGIRSIPPSRVGCGSRTVRSPCRAFTHNIDDVGWKAVRPGPLRNGTHAAPAISATGRGANQLHESAACKGLSIPVGWHDVQ